MKLPEKLPPRGYVDRKSEGKLPFKVDESRDYMAEIDKACPPWRPSPYSKSDVLSSSAAFSDNTGPNVFVDMDAGAEYSTPHNRFVRAINPQGHIVSLLVSTCRPSPERPDGDDGLGTYDRVIAEKMRRGWRILEPESSFEGRYGAEYLAWCLEVQKFRKAINDAREQEDQNAYESKQLAATKAQTAANADMVKSITEGLGKAIVEGLSTANQATSKKAKGE